jgi:UPF0755 protein
MASFVKTLVILTLIVLCLVLTGVVAAVYSLPRIAMEQFGPPGPALGLRQHIVYSFRLVSNQNALTRPLDPDGISRSFTVNLGETVTGIAYRLEDERFIRNADALRTYLIYAGLDTGVQAGRYELSPAMTTIEIAHALQDSTPEEVLFNILPGWRLEEVAAALPTSGLAVTSEAFLSIAYNPPAEILPEGYPALRSLEGFLLPGAYQIRRDITAGELAALFLTRFDESITPDLRNGFAAQGLNLQEAVILASIVQREAVVSEEQPLIASVFYNRLFVGMRLDSDPTVQYAVGYDPASGSWWKNPLTISDLRFDSRYNTYIYTGLPPGPICNPGIEALRSVAYPEQSGYYFFRAQCDGSGRHFFAVTYEEHLQNACP